ncbi:hypothetical protein EON83_08530 [bacterium]|nr:MAG: hypothetical protein EON83_08530 [bacterium]
MAQRTSRNSSPRYQLFAQAFSSRHGSRRAVRHFPTYKEALALAVNRVMGDLKMLHDPEMDAKELFDLWKKLGDDFFIVPDNEPAPFSSTDLARLITPRLTHDQSRPLLLEVTCTDCLGFASGGYSPPKEWKFWVKAPATYTDATHLIRRATEYLYKEMSVSAKRAEGSCYKLIDMQSRELSEEEAQQISPSLANETVYYIQNDGSFEKTAP